MTGAIVLHANHHVFPAGWSTAHGPVRSVMQLWCRGGRGMAEVDGHRFDLTPGSLVLMPWMHRVRFRADPDEAWRVGGVHVVPRCTPPQGTPPPFWCLPHHDRHPLAEVGWLRDAEEPILTTPRCWSLPADHPAILLGEFVTARFRPDDHDEVGMRRCAELLIDCWVRLLKEDPTDGLPESLRRVEQLIANGGAAPSLDDCVAAAGVSRATLTRLARRHWGRSVHGQLRAWQLERAQELLRTTPDPVGTIARECGFGDPLYFSRVFRQELGMSPKAWRERYAGL